MYTNNTGIPLSFAVWLAADNGYDLQFNPARVSATELLRPMRSIILSREIAAAKIQTGDDGIITQDIAEKAASALGTAVHTAIELAWKKYYKLALSNLGWPEKAIEALCINPNNPQPENFNVYFEIRSEKEIEDFTLSGKFDLCIDGQVHDIKTTKTYTYINGSNDEKYIQQGSIYRWLNQDIITNPHMLIDYYFTDWTPNPRTSEKEIQAYPPNRMLSKSLPLMTLDDTEYFIRQRLFQIKQNTGKSQDELPRCTPAELWQNPSKWEYWSKTTNKQCSKLLDTKTEAMSWLAEKGAGFIQERLFTPTFCNYCAAKSICTQAQGYIAQGLLTA